MDDEPIDSIHMFYQFKKFESFLGLERLYPLNKFIMILVQTFFSVCLFTVIGFSFFFGFFCVANFFCRCCCPTGKAKEKEKMLAIGQPKGRKTATQKKSNQSHTHTLTQTDREK